MRRRFSFTKPLLLAAAVAAMLGSVSAADAQPFRHRGPPPPPPPRGWVGPHYYWHGRYYHRREPYFDRYHHRHWRYR
ncbi:hypothetical protein [Lichenicoccus sp.]|uniref:hypothetical protein n=1 Tax=Lichenicoccus sp. TaxID=2781899 RepID=UPI003D14291F